jgi:hypothetical protein
LAKSIEVKGIKEVELMLKGIKDGSRKALVRSINASFVPVRKEAVKEIRKEYNILASEAKSAFLRPYRANRTNLVGKLTAVGRPLDFMRNGKLRFSGSERKDSFAFTIKKGGFGRGGGGRKVFKNAFIGISRRGVKHVYVFNEQTGIKTAYSARVTDVLSNDERMNPILKKAETILQEKLEKATNDLLRGY